MYAEKVAVLFWLRHTISRLIRRWRTSTRSMKRGQKGGGRAGTIPTTILLDGSPLDVTNLGGAGLGEWGSAILVLRSKFPRRLLSTGFRRGTLEAGEHELVLECVEAGSFGFDYFWIRKF